MGYWIDRSTIRGDPEDRLVGCSRGLRLRQYGAQPVPAAPVALAAQQSESAQTYVSCCDGVVAGYYSLVVGGVERAGATTRVAKGMPQHPVPVMILARLAVDREHQRIGLGKALLKDALKRTAQAADIAGIRALLVHAKDEEARKWYLQWEFEPSPTDPMHLFLLMKDLKALLRGGA